MPRWCVALMKRNGRRFSHFETPIFLTREFTDELTRAPTRLSILPDTEIREARQKRDPERIGVPKESLHPNFLVVDFICAEGDGWCRD
jgi:hypothetical protein